VARIELVNLVKSYGAVAAVRDLSYTIEDGEFVVFVGPSGCGKTTTLRLIAGFEEPDGGEIRIDGRVVNDLEPRDRGLGMVFQSHALFPHKTVAQNIEFGLRMKKVPREERARRVREVAAMVRLTDLLGKLPSACSGGEAQRVALARTLVTNPSTFLLDEPLSSLDAKLRRELRAECDRLHQELRRTFIFVLPPSVATFGRSLSSAPRSEPRDQARHVGAVSGIGFAEARAEHRLLDEGEIDGVQRRERRRPDGER